MNRTTHKVEKNTDDSYTVSEIPVPIEVGDFTILGTKIWSKYRLYLYRRRVDNYYNNTYYCCNEERSDYNGM